MSIRRDDTLSVDDRWKRRAYLALIAIGMPAAIVMLADREGDLLLRVIFVAVITTHVVVLTGLLTHRLPMPWADRLIFGVLVVSLLLPIARWALPAGDVPAPVDGLAIVLWAGVLFPIAFLIFGTRRGAIVALGSYVVLAVAVIGVITARPGRLPGQAIEAIIHLAFIYPAVIALLWVLSTRVEQLATMRARMALLAEEAASDALTGLANRRRLVDELDRHIAAAQRHGEPLSIGLLDLDRFKRINDRYGHDGGDQVLVTVAERLEAAVRTSDLVGRWGGEEFLVIMPRAELGDATEVAERCRRSLAASVAISDETVTASFGVATLAVDDDRRTLLRRADLALYSAKTEGRDRVVALNGVSHAGEAAAEPASRAVDDPTGRSP